MIARIKKLAIVAPWSGVARGGFFEDAAKARV